MRRFVLFVSICFFLISIGWSAAGSSWREEASKDPGYTSAVFDCASWTMAGRRAWISRGLALANIHRQEKSFKVVTNWYPVYDDVLASWRQENLDEANEYAGQIAHIEKIQKAQGSRPDLNKKLATARKSIADLRACNFDLFLVRLRTKICAGEMAEELGKQEDACGIYSSALGMQYLLSCQNFTDLSQEQIADFQEWGGWPAIKLRRLGVDPDELLRTIADEMKKSGRKVPSMPLF